MKLRTRILLPIIAVCTMAFAAVATSPKAYAAAYTECTTNSVVYCGVTTVSELQSKYSANASSDLDNIYSHYGISAAMIADSSKIKQGTVTKDGKVIVDGKVIATNAYTMGRHDMTGSTKITIGGKTYYQRPTSISFSKDTYNAFVFLDANGKFVAAILQPCGNPVKATPVTPPPTPVAACVSVQKIQKSRDTYDFKATASASGGAKISNYSFRITHSSGTAKIINVATTATTASSGSVQLETGTHTVKVVVTTSAGEKTSAACETTVTIPEEEMTRVCNPVTGETITVKKTEASKYKPEGDVACKVRVCEVSTKQIIMVDKAEASKYLPVDDEACKPKVQGVTTVTPPTIASTGPTDILAGGAGISSLTAAGYYWRASRRRVLSSLLNR